jgi:DNA topoisomerase IB
MPGLVEVDPASPGFSRRRSGRGFTYLDRRGRRLSDRRVLARIKALAIPPAWEDVWICPDPKGHLQATGLDDRGRRQYRYHDEWRLARDRDKHDRILRFARALPDLRAKVRRDLHGDVLDKPRVLAAAVRLMELGNFRVGGEAYASENGSFGLATVRKDHVCVRGDSIVFDYPAKSGVQRMRELADDDLLDVVRALRRRRSGGDELLAYRNDDGEWCDVRSEDINAYIQDAIGEDFSAKDFRTWHATVLAAAELAAVEDEPETEAARRRTVAGVMRAVADELGNTPAVARSSYVDPRVVEEFERGRTVLDVHDDLDDDDLEVEGSIPRDLEAAVLDLIEAARRRRRRSR